MTSVSHERWIESIVAAWAHKHQLDIPPPALAALHAMLLDNFIYLESRTQRETLKSHLCQELLTHISSSLSSISKTYQESERHP